MRVPVPGSLRRSAAHLLTLSRQQAGLRLVIGIAPLTTLLLAHLAGAEWSAWYTGVVLAFSALTALEPDSSLGLVVLGLLGWAWYSSVTDVRTPWTVAAALTMLAFHVACAASSIGPPATVLASETLRRWVRRSLTVGVLTVAVWAAEQLVTGLHAPGNVVLTVSALVTAAVLALTLRQLSGESR